jgi:hypothetical protein
VSDFIPQLTVRSVNLFIFQIKTKQKIKGRQATSLQVMTDGWTG